MEEDPVVCGGYALGEVRPFRVSLLRGRDLPPQETIRFSRPLEKQPIRASRRMRIFFARMVAVNNHAGRMLGAEVISVRSIGWAA